MAKLPKITWSQTVRADLRYLFIESYGVRLRVSSNDDGVIETIREMIPNVLAGNFCFTSPVESEHNFHYKWNPSARDSLYSDEGKVVTRMRRAALLERLARNIRLTVAEFAVGKVFIHAGVVSWKGKALVIPAPSFSGKSALVAELVRRGASYYSDEYAVLDENGMVSPFPKMMSIRGVIDEYQQVDYPVEAFGGKLGTETIIVGMILITKYKAKAKWKPQVLTQGNGLMEIIRNTIPIQNNPLFSLAVLKKVIKNSIVVKSPRGDAKESAGHILHLLETQCELNTDSI